MSPVILFWLLASLALLGGTYALNQIVTNFLTTRDVRHGKFSGPSRASAKQRLKMEFLTILAAAKLGQSTVDLEGIDAFVDDFVEAIKQELRQESKSWQ